MPSFGLEVSYEEAKWREMACFCLPVFAVRGGDVAFFDIRCNERTEIEKIQTVKHESVSRNRVGLFKGPGLGPDYCGHPSSLANDRKHP